MPEGFTLDQYFEHVARAGFAQRMARIRQLASIYQEAEVEDALALMRSTGAHIARSFDANGDTTGLLFLEDIIEELVGEVRDATRRLF